MFHKRYLYIYIRWSLADGFNIHSEKKFIPVMCFCTGCVLIGANVQNKTPAQMCFNLKKPMGQQPRKKILFLYFELAGYFMACINRLIELYEVDVHIVRYPVNAIAPFDFKANEKIHFYEYERDAATEGRQAGGRLQHAGGDPGRAPRRFGACSP